MVLKKIKNNIIWNLFGLEFFCKIVSREIDLRLDFKYILDLSQFYLFSFPSYCIIQQICCEIYDVFILCKLYISYLFYIEHI